MNKSESAKLIMELYALRREKVMRKARKWMQGFAPQSAEEVSNAMMDEKIGAYLRMVLSYWDMAATFVNHGAIDAEMFAELNGEQVMTYARIEPALAELRVMWDMPDAFKNLEKAVLGMPDGAERVKKSQDFMKQMAEMRSEAEGKSEEASA